MRSIVGHILLGILDSSEEQLPYSLVASRIERNSHRKLKVVNGRPYCRVGIYGVILEVGVEISDRIASVKAAERPLKLRVIYIVLGYYGSEQLGCINAVEDILRAVGFEEGISSYRLNRIRNSYLI